MSSYGSTSIRGIVSNTRITLGLLPGLGAMIVMRMAIHLYRPDIEDAENRVRDHPFDQLYDCYDFIIVGAGSAGSVLANRLSENPEWKVLLLEAGEDENVLSEVPVLFPILQLSSIDWQFVTEPNEGYCLSMVDGRCKWPRGKVLGGSSVLNAMLYIRGNKRDYDYWAELGNTGWSYKDILPYFLRAEDIRIPEYQNDPYHSTGGPLTVEYFKYEQPITRDILQAGEQLGYKIIDVNGEYQTGFTRSQATIRDGLRCSTAKAYLRPASKRENLHISINSLVEKILIDEQKRAYGVKFKKNSHQRIIRASREVILSAGAIQSPQLLMLSGIGDAEHLKEVGIYPIANLRGVGKNLQDHVAMGGHSYLFDNPYENGTDYCFNLNSVFSLGEIIDFSVHHNGSLYSMMEAEAMAFVNTKYQDPAEDYPDIQLFIAPTADNMDGGWFGKRSNGLTDETYAELYEDILYEPSFSVVPLLLRPKSRGYLKLRDSSAYSPPLIYPNYYSHPHDVEIMIEGARIVQKLVEQPALAALNARPNPRRNPGCERYDLMSDEHLECQARHHSLTIYHPVGTCAMGPAGDPYAVVDPRLRVYNIKNLRVVDGSIMPKIVSGNTNAPIIAIAEKASDMIKEDWYEMPYDQTICSPGYYQQNKESNDEGPSRIQLNPGTHLDVFNETIDLFPHLPINGGSSMIKEMKKTDRDKIPIVSPEFETKNNDILPVSPYNLVNNPYVDTYKAAANFESTPNQYKLVNPYPYLNNYIYNYVVNPYPYWPVNILRDQIVYPNEINRNNNAYNYKSDNHNILKPNQLTYTKPYFNNIPADHNFNHMNVDEKTHKKAEEPFYYEINEIMTPKGQRKCKVWLYYDGMKYEVIL